MRFALASTLLAATTLAACSDDHGHEHDDPDVEGCEHLAGGPFAPVTATDNPSAAPAIRADHQAYTVTLPARPIGQGGFVTFAAPEAIDYLFVLDQPVVATFATGSGAVTPEESGTGSPACAEIQRRYLVALPVGTATIELTSPDVTSVNVVVEPASHGH
ncbi:MAG TPA: hypothetical protein VM734_03020 [Kofleriaceae bacterium]|nr:hypothetical protein [Kofleriaceae bacterium]